MAADVPNLAPLKHPLPRPKAAIAQNRRPLASDPKSRLARSGADRWFGCDGLRSFGVPRHWYEAFSLFRGTSVEAR